MLKDAEWIWADIPDGVNQYVRFEADFETDVPEGISAAVSVSGEYALYINGTLAGFGQFGNWPEKKTYNIHDVSGACVPGVNRMELTAWHMGIDSMVSVAGEGKACFRVCQGDRTLVSSGGHIMSGTFDRYRQGVEVPLITGQLGFSFEYDSTSEVSGMKPSKPCLPPMSCSPRPVPLLEMNELIAGNICYSGCYMETGASNELPAARMMKAGLAFIRQEDMLKDGWYTAQNGDGICLIFDLGRETAGYFSMEAELDEEAEILIGWGEHLKDLRVRTSVGGRNFCAVYRAGRGINRFMHPFRRMGCRYIQLHIPAKRVKIGHVGMIPVVYPMPSRNDMDITDSLHRRIYEVACDTLELCVHDHYEDCPWREQALYAMDSRIQILCGYYVFGETKMPRACLELLAGGLREDGLLEICAPAKAPITIPCFSLAFIVELWEYVLYTGDTDVSQLADTAIQIIDAFENHMDDRGRLLRFREKKYWNFYEWQPGLDGDGPYSECDICEDIPDGLLTGWYVYALDCCAKLLAAIGRHEQRNRIGQRLMSARRAMDDFWDEERQLYAAEIRKGRKLIWSELMQSLAVIGGVCDEERAGNLRRRLAERKGMIPVTLNDALIRYQVLMQAEEEYAGFVFDEIGRIWGGMLMQGATSFWETELGEADFNHAGSLCHGWSAVPVYFYHAYAMGMRPEAPGIMKKHPVYLKL